MANRLDEFRDRLLQQGYLAEDSLAMSIYLCTATHRPLFLEGEPGVGKTEVAKVMARVLDTELIRLQCYRGLEANTVLFEWNYLKQILSIRIAEAGIRAGDRLDGESLEREIFGLRFLVERPLLRALRQPKPPVLLIDEVDRADEDFEAFLLEFLSDYQVSIPEVGTVHATAPPYVVLTSNRTRMVHDALRRRCLYHWIEYPSLAKELAIVRLQVPELDLHLARQLCGFMQVLRRRELAKQPGLAETLDWSRVLLHLGVGSLEEEQVITTLGAVCKTREDRIEVEAGFQELIREANRLAQAQEVQC